MTFAVSINHRGAAMARGERVAIEYTMSIRLTSILLLSYLLYILTPQPAFEAYPRNNPRCRIQKYTCPGIPIRGCQITASHRLVHLDISVLSPPQVFFHVGHLKACGRSPARSRSMWSSCQMTRPFALLRIIGERKSVENWPVLKRDRVFPRVHLCQRSGV